ncbi:MAG TPA: Uma2 family endonuclease [Gemmataceae bacterium]|nr:Uma2 family endonuclease [Gemmataceae bacterium]
MTFETNAELLEALGGIDPGRIRLRPLPGEATEGDVLTFLEKEHRLFELVDGTLVEKVMGMKEAWIAGIILTEINLFLSVHDLGFATPGDGPLKILARLVRMPDVSFISWLQLPERKIPDQPIPELYPDLAVDVFSTGNTWAEMKRKLKEYFLAGTRLVWIVYPETRTVDVYTAPEKHATVGENAILDGGNVLQGFKLPVAKLFAKLPNGERKKGENMRKKRKNSQ